MASKKSQRSPARPSGSRYPCQLVVMVTEDTDRAVRQAAARGGRAVSEALREVIDTGLPVTITRWEGQRSALAAALQEA